MSAAVKADLTTAQPRGCKRRWASCRTPLPRYMGDINLIINKGKAGESHRGAVMGAAMKIPCRCGHAPQ